MDLNAKFNKFKQNVSANLNNNLSKKTVEKKEEKKQETLFDLGQANLKKDKLQESDLFGGMVSFSKKEETPKEDTSKTEKQKISNSLSSLLERIVKNATLQDVTQTEKKDEPAKLETFAPTVDPSPTLAPMTEPDPTIWVPLPEPVPNPTCDTKPVPDLILDPVQADYTARDIFTILGGKDADAEKLLQVSDWGSNQAGGSTGVDNQFLISKNDLEQALNSYPLDSYEGSLIRMFYNENGPTALFRGLAKVGWAWGGVSNDFLDFGEIVDGLGIDRKSVSTQTLSLDNLTQKLAEFEAAERPVIPAGEKGSLEYVVKLLGMNAENIVDPKYDEEGRIISFTDNLMYIGGESPTYTVSYNWDLGVTIDKIQGGVESPKTEESKRFDKNGELKEMFVNMYNRAGLCEYSYSMYNYGKQEYKLERQYNDMGLCTYEHFDYCNGNEYEIRWSYNENGQELTYDCVDFHDGIIRRTDHRETEYNDKGQQIKFTLVQKDENGKVTNNYLDTYSYYDNGNLKKSYYNYEYSDGSVNKGITNYYENGNLKDTLRTQYDVDGLRVSDIKRKYDENGALVSTEGRQVVKANETGYIWANGRDIVLTNKNGENSEVSYIINADGHMELNANGMEIEQMRYELQLYYGYEDEPLMTIANEVNVISDVSNIKRTDIGIDPQVYYTPLCQRYWGEPMRDLTINGNNNTIKGTELDDNISVYGNNNVVDLGEGEDTLNIVGNNNKIKNVEEVTMNPSTPVIKPGEVGSVEFFSNLLGVDFSNNRTDGIKYDAQGRLTEFHCSYPILTVMENNLYSGDKFNIQYNDDGSFSVTKEAKYIHKGVSLINKETGEITHPGEILISSNVTVTDYNAEGKEILSKQVIIKADGTQTEETFVYNADGVKTERRLVKKKYKVDDIKIGRLVEKNDSYAIIYELHELFSSDGGLISEDTHYNNSGNITDNFFGVYSYDGSSSTRQKTNYIDGKEQTDIITGYDAEGNVIYVVEDNFLGFDTPAVYAWDANWAQISFDGGKIVEVSSGEKAVINEEGTVTVTKADESRVIYDKDGNLISESRPNPNIIEVPEVKPGEIGSIEYLNSLNPKWNINPVDYKATLDEKGRITHLSFEREVHYDGVISIYRQYGTEYSISYDDEKGEVTVSPYEIGIYGAASHSYTYNANKELIREDISNGSLGPSDKPEVIEYNSDGTKTVTIYDANGNVIETKKYDKDGNLE